MGRIRAASILSRWANTKRFPLWALPGYSGGCKKAHRPPVKTT
ncbi:hypothetical protein [Anaerocolumna sp. MB42-C2]|nr:hypothetical protein [Anaerocolumna sp. MB42-C2]WMJ85745.1 hypothetical protein RBU59_16945 [Anaerocolumna sp. MB42-C2]